VRSFKASLFALKVIDGDSKALQVRREITREVPVGSQVLLPETWLKPHVSDSFFDNRRFMYRGLEEVGKTTVADLMWQGFDLACIMNYVPETPIKEPAYFPVFFKQLTERKVEPVFTQPRISHYRPQFGFVPVQPGDGESFHVALHFREPGGGDWAGIRGIVPPPVSPEAAATTRSLVLQARLINLNYWLPGFLHWEISSDGKRLWEGMEARDTSRTALSLPIQARPGAAIQIRVLRTDYRQDDATWGWGGAPSNLKIDGLRVVAADTRTPIPIQWRYVGRNGGPGPARYAMRTDWLHNANPPPLRDPGFDGEEPLVEAWRPRQLIEPKDKNEFPQQTMCRKMARVEKAAGRGMNGGNALRFVVGFPAIQSAQLGIMQPIAYPACQRVRKIRIHYCADGEAGNLGEVELRLAATALSLSGEYIDRAEIKTPAGGAPNQWKSLRVNLDRIWARKHTRVDLMDFLEVAIEFTAGPGAVFDYLIDNVELE
jgi:hypothetical protein